MSPVSSWCESVRQMKIEWFNSMTEILENYSQVVLKSIHKALFEVMTYYMCSIHGTYSSGRIFLASLGAEQRILSPKMTALVLKTPHPA